MNNTQQIFITLLDTFHLDYTYIEDDKDNMVLYTDNSELKLSLLYFHIGPIPIIIISVNDDIFMGYDDGSLYNLIVEITKL